MDPKPDIRAASVRMRVYGDVQGVFYRSWAVAAAKRIGVKGWVRNRKDGSVELHVEGPEDAVEQFYYACHTGPPLAFVETIARADIASEAPTDFEERASE